MTRWTIGSASSSARHGSAPARNQGDGAQCHAGYVDEVLARGVIHVYLGHRFFPRSGAAAGGAGHRDLEASARSRHRSLGSGDATPSSCEEDDSGSLDEHSKGVAWDRPDLVGDPRNDGFTIVRLFGRSP